MIAVLNNILTELDKPNTAVLVANFDMSAAFDTVNHQIFLARLRNKFGITDPALKWFQSYLHTRKVCVVIAGEESDILQLDCSLPQGSNLGLRLYSDYTKPLGALLKLLILLYHCYADDTSLAKPMPIKSVREQLERVDLLADSISQIQIWTHKKKLKLNPEKTEFIIVASSKNRNKIKVSNLTLPESTIPASSSVRSLGVTIDSSLSMENRIAAMCKTCYNYIKWIRSIRPYISVDQAKSLVQTLIICRIDYCNALLIGLPEYLISRLQRIMNTAARLIFRVPPAPINL